MALIFGSTRTDSTAQPLELPAKQRNAAKRKVMAKETIRNASVFRPVRQNGRKLVPVRRLEGKAKSEFGPTCPQDSGGSEQAAMEPLCGGIEEQQA
jgi:hypothetical protein